MMQEPAVPGVCMVTSGPGLTNMITAMLDAQYDSTPLVVFSGQVPTHVMGTYTLQRCFDFPPTSFEPFKPASYS